MNGGKGRVSKQWCLLEFRKPAKKPDGSLLRDPDTNEVVHVLDQGWLLGTSADTAQRHVNTHFVALSPEKRRQRIHVREIPADEVFRLPNYGFPAGTAWPAPRFHGVVLPQAVSAWFKAQGEDQREFVAEQKRLAAIRATAVPGGDR